MIPLRTLKDAHTQKNNVLGFANQKKILTFIDIKQELDFTLVSDNGVLQNDWNE